MLGGTCIFAGGLLWGRDAFLVLLDEKIEVMAAVWQILRFWVWHNPFPEAKV